MKKEKEVAKSIVELLENNNTTLKEWERIKFFVDDTFCRIINKSNFKSDEVTQKRIDNWF